VTEKSQSIKYYDTITLIGAIAIMPMKSRMVALRICGNCAHAKGSLRYEEIDKLERAYVKYFENERAFLALLRRQAKRLKETKILCRKENTEMSVFEEACAFWKKK
jgi:hypothetical protein